MRTSYRKNFTKPSRSKYSPLNNNVKPVCACTDPKCPYEKGKRGTTVIKSVEELLIKPDVEITI